MPFTESLDWILDPKDPDLRFSDEKIQENIAFVHSLGLKCDSVGWCTLRDLSAPDTDGILQKIAAFCQKNAFTARGFYTRTWVDPDSEWFELVGAEVSSEAIPGFFNVPDETGAPRQMYDVKAYLLPRNTPVDLLHDLLVPDSFRRAVLRNQIPSVQFCWMPDLGKFEAEQHFLFQPEHAIPFFACDQGLSDLSRSKMKRLFPSFGGKLPELPQLFSELTVSLPTHFRASDLPSGGFAYAYSASPTERTYYHLLVHRDTADLLLHERVITQKNLQPVPVLSEFPNGYPVLRTQRKATLPQETVNRFFTHYKELLRKDRPKRMIPEKETLRLLRRVKTARKEDFHPALSLSAVQALAETESPLLPLFPYYRIANGGILSDEYTFLSADEASAETTEFQSLLRTEELLESVPESTVFAVCADGDRVSLQTDGRVLRFCHESPETELEWPSLAQFFAEAIEEE